MKAKYKELNLEGNPEEIFMFYVVSKLEKKIQKELENELNINNKASKKRNNLKIWKGEEK